MISDSLKVFETLFLQVYYSLVSKNFFEKIVRSYSGFGIKYVLANFFLPCLIIASSLSYDCMEIRLYLSDGYVSERTQNLEKIINQIPALYYDGKNLKSDFQDPVYLYSATGLKFAAIDTQNKLSYQEKSQIPITFTGERIFIPDLFGTSEASSNKPFLADYRDLFPEKSANIDSSFVKTYLKKIFASIPELFFFGISIGLTLKYSFGFLAQNFFLSTILYGLSLLLNIKITFKIIFRSLVFAQGFYMLASPIVQFLNLSFFSIILEVLRIWRYILLTFYLFIKGRKLRI